MISPKRLEELIDTTRKYGVTRKPELIAHINECMGECGMLRSNEDMPDKTRQESGAIINFYSNVLRYLIDGKAEPEYRAGVRRFLRGVGYLDNKRVELVK